MYVITAFEFSNNWFSFLSSVRVEYGNFQSIKISKNCRQKETWKSYSARTSYSFRTNFLLCQKIGGELEHSSVKGRMNIKVKKGLLFVIDEGEIIAEMEQTILSLLLLESQEIFPLSLRWLC